VAALYEDGVPGGLKRPIIFELVMLVELNPVALVSETNSGAGI
jgi:hypothetical protein